MSKISRALEKAKKEREQRRSPDPSLQAVRHDSVVIDSVKGVQPLDAQNHEPTLFDQSDRADEARPQIHDPELHRIKVRRRSPYHPRRRSHVRMAVITVLSLFVLFGVMAYIYVQLNQDPFETLSPVTTTGPAAISSAFTGDKALEVTAPSAVTRPPAASTQRAPVQAIATPETDEAERQVVVEKAAPLEITNMIRPPDEERDVVRAPVAGVPFIKPVASFDSGQRLNELGGVFRTFADDKQYLCNDFFNSLHARLGTGFALKLVYDVNATKPTRNGLVMDLATIQVNGYKALSFYMKGDQERGFTTTVIAGIESSHRTRMYRLNNVTYRWEKVVIPLTDFSEKGEALKEFRFIFQSDYVTTPTGAVFLDDVTLEK